MSFFNIFNKPGALDNKSLNLYANTVYANNLTANSSFNGTPPTVVDEVVVYNSTDGTKIKESGLDSKLLFLTTGGRAMTGDVDCGNHEVKNASSVSTAILTSTGATTLRGGVFPDSSTSAAGALLTNNGTGTLSWSPLIAGGSYAPTIVPSGNITSTVLKTATYIVVGSTMLLSLYVIFTVDASPTDRINITTPIPPGYNITGGEITCQANCPAPLAVPDTYTNMITEAQNDSALTSAYVELKRPDNVNLVAGDYYVNLTFTFPIVRV